MLRRRCRVYALRLSTPINKFVKMLSKQSKSSLKNFNPPPTQESIWKLLDGGFSSTKVDSPDQIPVSDHQTLAEKSDSCGDHQTPAEKLIASIRANMFSLSDGVEPKVTNSHELPRDSADVLSPKSPCSDTAVASSLHVNHEVTSLPILNDELPIWNDETSTAFDSDKEPSVCDRKNKLEFTSNSKKVRISYLQIYNVCVLASFFTQEGNRMLTSGFKSFPT